MDIVIYTNPETLLHKTMKGYHCYWSMSRPPKEFNDGDRIYFAIKGEVAGYVVPFSFDREDNDRTFEWDTKTWEPIDVVSAWRFCKSFRGFRYRWWRLSKED